MRRLLLELFSRKHRWGDSSPKDGHAQAQLLAQKLASLLQANEFSELGEFLWGAEFIDQLFCLFDESCEWLDERNVPLWGRDQITYRASKSLSKTLSDRQIVWGRVAIDLFDYRSKAHLRGRPAALVLVPEHSSAVRAVNAAAVVCHEICNLMLPWEKERSSMRPTGFMSCCIALAVIPIYVDSQRLKHGTYDYQLALRAATIASYNILRSNEWSRCFDAEIGSFLEIRRSLDNDLPNCIAPVLESWSAILQGEASTAGNALGDWPNKLADWYCKWAFVGTVPKEKRTLFYSVAPALMMAMLGAQKRYMGTQ
jgi:hypothetical protein